MNRLEAITEILKDKQKIFKSGSFTMYFDEKYRRVAMANHGHVVTKLKMEYVALQEKWILEGLR